MSYWGLTKAIHFGQVTNEEFQVMSIVRDYYFHNSFDSDEFAPTKMLFDAEKFHAIVNTLRLRGPECVRDKLLRRACVKCGKTGFITASHYRLCGRCLNKRYCSVECQQAHWDEGHKDECEPPPEPPAG